MTNAVQSTSIDAMWDVERTLGERHRTVLAALQHQENFTNNKLSHFLDWPINTVTPRINELRKKGRVCEDCRRPCKITNRTVIAWKLVTRGQAPLLTKGEEI